MLDLRKLEKESEYIVVYDGWAVPIEYIDYDGCTMPKILKRLVKSYRFDNTICRLHDFQWEYNFIPKATADKILRKAIQQYNPELDYIVVSWVVWLVVRIVSLFRYNTKDLPTKWLKFGKQIK